MSSAVLQLVLIACVDALRRVQITPNLCSVMCSVAPSEIRALARVQAPQKWRPKRERERLRRFPRYLTDVKLSSAKKLCFVLAEGQKTHELGICASPRQIALVDGQTRVAHPSLGCSVR